MEIYISSVVHFLLCLIGMIAYAEIMRVLLPRLFMKPQFRVDGKLGRGLDKYKYPTGRAVVYEPDPAIRKYINKYALFTNDGYKYIKLKLDRYVRTLVYSVVMFNNKGKIVDVIDVSENAGVDVESKSILLHHDTSYVAFALKAVNGQPYGAEQTFAYRTALNIALYAASVSVLTFLSMLFTVWSFGRGLYEISYGEIPEVALEASAFVLPALAVGALATAILLLHGVKRGIRTVLHGR